MMAATLNFQTGYFLEDMLLNIFKLISVVSYEVSQETKQCSFLGGLYWGFVNQLDEVFDEFYENVYA